ncbi:UDP-N-acetylglucosamine 4,6-dehydratase [Acidisarcina polymorpha]|uniref:UDP-N-acetylglucosamine 4,6-dehydratase n=1 Tax=Acidisarcina polymorpha TaxID=2211140 RepID=A0A2Z5FSR1_9BACT|nr:polysaccharide biosynthesis protein [Acidisarcina polymorpha]AXC09859.1 UDP-N-acetylglucosamine 4,6-dehydratase [Acidisarcina polymorpha]
MVSTSVKAGPEWADFLGRVPVAVDEALAALAVGGRRVLITGAGGSIGSGLAQAALLGQPELLALLDVSESALHQSFRSVSSSSLLRDVEVIPVTGNVSDERLLEHLFHRYQIDLILHTAAYKHVPLMESNPFSAIANNSIGTYKLVKAAQEAEVASLILLSTDKAVRPRGIMGASKRLAELVVLSHATESLRMNVVRLGNVLGSSGSVALVFQEQATQEQARQEQSGQKQAGPGCALTVTDAEASRYFLTQSEAEVAILNAASSPDSGKIYIADCGECIRVVDLAKYIGGPAANIRYIGLRRGDKLHEELIAQEERVAPELFGGMRVVDGFLPSSEFVIQTIKQLEEAIFKYDYPDMIKAVQNLVPGYQPDITGSKVSRMGAR